MNPMNPTSRPIRRPAVSIIFIWATLCLVRSGVGIAAPKEGKTPPAAKAGEAAIAHNNLGIALLAQFKAGDAEKEFRESLAAAPSYLPAMVNVGIAQLAQVRYPEAT